jgi:hypothetical protein
MQGLLIASMTTSAASDASVTGIQNISQTPQIAAATSDEPLMNALQPGQYDNFAAETLSIASACLCRGRGRRSIARLDLTSENSGALLLEPICT